MPIYTYHCENCDNQFDQRQSFSEDSLLKCPKCGEIALQKVYYPPRVVFKGHGYYVTDNKSPKSNGRNGKSESEENGSKENKSNKDSAETKANKAEKPVTDSKPKEKSKTKS